MNNFFAVQAYNNAWSNFRLGKACTALSPKELSQARTGFFPTIIETLNHIHIVDRFYVSALEGRCIGLKAFEPLIPFPELEQLIAEQRKIDQRLIEVCSNSENSVGERLIEMVRGDSVQIERFDRTFLHLTQHQIHHRGQVHCMLSGTSVPPPQLDEFFMAWDADKNLRAPDLQELGISEDEIWLT